MSVHWTNQEGTITPRAAGTPGMAEQFAAEARKHRCRERRAWVAFSLLMLAIAGLGLAAIFHYCGGIR